MQLGDSKKERGSSFVGLSRATDIKNIFLGNGDSLERLTTEISKIKIRLIEGIRLEKLYVDTCLTFLDVNIILF